MTDSLPNSDWTTVFNEIKNADLPPAEKVARAFEWVINVYLEHGEKELELLRAMGDQESLIKEQIKQASIKHARSVFRDCFKFIVGGSVWDE